jgi:hypothetical protein
MKTKKPSMPSMPASGASEKERQKFRRDMLKWCNKYRGVKLNAKGLDQERLLIEVMSQSPDEQQRKDTAAKERVRNLLGSDFEIVWD